MLKRHITRDGIPILKNDHVWTVSFIFEDEGIPYYGFAKYKCYGIKQNWHEVEVFEHSMFPFPKDQAIVDDELFGFISRPIH